MRKLNWLVSLFLLASMAVVTGCGSKLPALKPYKMDIQQGNVITSKMLLQLRPGMTKAQVRYVLGTPLIVDSFHGNRWDYFYELSKQGKVVNKRRVILDFDQEALVAVRGDVVPSTGAALEEESTVLTEPKSIAPSKKVETSWWDKMKFWKKSDAIAEPEVKADANLIKGADAKNLAKATTDATAEAASTSANVMGEAADAAKEASNDGVAVAGAVAGTAAITAEAIAAESTNDEPVSVLRKEIELPDSTKQAPLPVEKPAKPATEANANENSDVQTEVVPATEAPAAVATQSVAEAPANTQAIADESEAIKQALNVWAEAWRSKNVNAYINAYVANYKADGMRTRNAWIAQRKSRLSPKQGAISLSIEDVNVTQNGNQATVQFYQKYQSKVYEDDVTKQLELVKDTKSNQWLIVKETTLANGKKPTVQKITAPEETNEHLDGVIEKIGF
jgi:outer membrane protein assembly factor BamE (lipoprotein component of BamABCDE complex)